MKVIVLGAHQSFNLEQYVVTALETLGYEVKFCGYREFVPGFANPLRMAISRSRLARGVAAPLLLRRYNEFVKTVGIQFAPGLVLSVKGEAVLPQTVEWLRRKTGAVTALWYPDDPRYFDSLARVIAPHYDFVFTASQKAIWKYKDLGVRVGHLPFACDPSVHKPFSKIEAETNPFALDLCFVGTFSRRRYAIIETLEASGLRVHVWGPYWSFFKRSRTVHGPVYGPEMAKVLSASRIVLNIHDETDVNFKPNMRVFEVAGCRSFLLTDMAFGLEKMFEVGGEVLCYNDSKQLIELVSRFLGLPKEREIIASRAQKRAYNEHTYVERVRSLTDAVGYPVD